VHDAVEPEKQRRRDGAGHRPSVDPRGNQADQAEAEVGEPELLDDLDAASSTITEATGSTTMRPITMTVYLPSRSPQASVPAGCQS